MGISQRAWFGPVLAFGVIPALLAVAVFGPQTRQTLTASIDLPVHVAFAIPLAFIWLVGVLVALISLWIAGWKAQSPDHRYRPVRLGAAGIIVTALIVGGLVLGIALEESGCGKGRDAIIAELVPLGDARATFSENDLTDSCDGEYTTTAEDVEVIAHHRAQLTSRGWTVTQSGATSFQPNFTARRGDLVVGVSVNRIEGKNWVQFSAFR